MCFKEGVNFERLNAYSKKIIVWTVINNITMAQNGSYHMQLITHFHEKQTNISLNVKRTF